LAIEKAIDQAKEGDIVLIAGKGHEKMQIFAHQTVPFDDCLVASQFLAKVKKA
jgi:UDP-N-acetylmuramoyl-L-alanyl-D-glutamate--2,6-diaminopimelate ligase